VGLIMVGFAVLALVVGRQISAGTTQDFASGLAEQAQIVARALKETVEESDESPLYQTDVSALLKAFSEQSGAEVVLLDGNGQLWASSSGDPQDTDTPEIRTALNGAGSSELRGGTAYAAAPVVDEGRVLAVVQLYTPLLAAQSLIWERWLSLVVTILAITILAGLAALMLSTTFTRPLERLQTAAMKIAQGDFSERVPETRQDEIGDVAEAFNYMADQVEAMLEQQRAFASNVSHELRTPLTTIRLRSEALRDSDLDEDLRRQYVVEIDDEVQRLGTLVQDLLVLSRLDSGRMEAGRERIDIARLARQLVSELKPQAERLGVDLQLELPATLPAVTASSAHLSIVFRNLLGNSLKYTSDLGQIRWSIWENDKTIEHSMMDTGQGISSEDLPHVFDRFYRVDKSHSREVPGTGLGLSLVRMIVEFYGGTVQISSKGAGEGTEVRVSWPIEDTPT
jgi:signal transduction histidine kinase